MRFWPRLVLRFFAVAVSISVSAAALAQTDGTARLEVTLQDYNGSSTRHYTVAWVTTGNGTFIKSLRKQGPSSWTSSQWNAHCTTWNSARAGSTALDGYTSATAQNYTGTNNPVILTWNGRDVAGNLMPDGQYKFWVQYAEDQNVQGPVTTGGLAWTKGSAGTTNTYPNQAGNFTNMRVTWVPIAVDVPLSFGSIRAVGSDLLLTGSGPANGPFSLLGSTNLGSQQWSTIGSGAFDSQGQAQVTLTNALGTAGSSQFYRLRAP